MSWSLRLVERVDGADGRSVDVVDIGEIAAPPALAMLGLTTVTAKTVLAAPRAEIAGVQEAMLTEAARRSRLPIKGHRRRVPQTPFGTVALRVPRLRGRGDDAKLVGWPRHARATPEFDRLRARLAAWKSYPAAMALLDELCPAASGVGMAAAHRTMARVAGAIKRSEIADGTPAAAHATLRLDTTFVRSADPARPRGLEILVGAIEPEGGGRRCFAAPVSLREQSLTVGRKALAAAGCGEETAIAAPTDGAVPMRHYAREPGAADIPISDWFHISMRIRHIEASAAAIDDSRPAAARGKEEVLEAIERMRHRRGNGHKTAARDSSRAVRAGLKEHPDEPMRKGRAQRSRTIRRAMKKTVAYAGNPQARLVNYAERLRGGERAATSLAEGGADRPVNARMARKQHMRRSERGAFNVLQVRAAHYNQRLAQQPIAA